MDNWLDEEIPRSYGHCNSFFGERCPFQALCFKELGWEKPLESGLFRIRRPHHDAELAAMREAGWQVPPEDWE